MKCSKNQFDELRAMSYVILHIVNSLFYFEWLVTESTKMPGLIIGVNEFIEETREDYNSPTTSTFVSRMGQCRQTIATLEEVIIR